MAEDIQLSPDGRILDSDGQLVFDPAQIGTSGGVSVTTARRTSGNISLNNTSWTNLDTGMDLVIAAAAGDVLEVSISGVTFGSASSTTAFFDVATIVSAAVVNTFSTEGAESGSSQGIQAWFQLTGADIRPLTGSATYTVQAGDISGGNVTLRLRGRCEAANARTIVAGTNNPLKWSVKNLG